MEIITGYVGKKHVTSEQERRACKWKQKFLLTMKLRSEMEC